MMTDVTPTKTPMTRDEMLTLAADYEHKAELSTDALEKSDLLFSAATFRFAASLMNVAAALG